MHSYLGTTLSLVFCFAPSERVPYVHWLEGEPRVIWTLWRLENHLPKLGIKLCSFRCINCTIILYQLSYPGCAFEKDNKEC